MEKTLISWSIPNLLSIWLMFAIGFPLLVLLVQFGMKTSFNSQAPADNSGGY